MSDDETIYEKTVMKKNASFVISLPMKEVRKMNLVHKQKVVFWIANNLIHIRPLEPGAWTDNDMAEIRAVMLTKSGSSQLIIPPKFIKLFEIKEGDIVQIKVKKDPKDRGVFLMRPKIQNKYVRMKHDGETSIVEVSDMNKDGTINKETTKTINTSYKNAHEMKVKIDAGEDPELENYIPDDESTMIDINIPPGWKAPIIEYPDDDTETIDDEEDEEHKI